MSGVSGQLLASAAIDGNPLALSVLNDATTALGWAIAQATTLIAPDIIVVGGGVAMMPESVFWIPLRTAVKTFRTVVAYHLPPRAVLIPRAFNSAAIWRRDAPPALICSTTGNTFSAWASARALFTAAPLRAA